jgi:hypothetical protein
LPGLPPSRPLDRAPAWLRIEIAEAIDLELIGDDRKQQMPR